MNAAEGVVRVDGEKLKSNLYPEPALFIAEEGVRVYSSKLIVLPPGKSMGVLFCHQAVTIDEVHFTNKELI